MHSQHRYVTSEPYSRVPGDRNSRHCVLDMDVYVRGPLHMLSMGVKGKNIVVDGLTVRTCFTAYSLDHSTTATGRCQDINDSGDRDYGCWQPHYEDKDLTLATWFSLNISYPNWLF